MNVVTHLDMQRKAKTSACAVGHTREMKAEALTNCSPSGVETENGRLEAEVSITETSPDKPRLLLQAKQGTTPFGKRWRV